MKALGKYLLSGKFKSMAMISLLTILSLLFPPLSFILSGTPLGLVTLRKGAVYGLHVLLGTFLLTAIFGYFSKMGFGLGVAFVSSVWLPVWATSMMLRVTESQALSILSAGGIGILFIFLLTFFNEELSVWWKSWVDVILENNFAGAERIQMQEVLDAILPLLSGIVAAGVVISLITTLLLARSWQSALFNPGGFRDEFQRLLLPRSLTFITFIFVIVSFINLGELTWLARNVLVVLLVLHVFQGIASVHRVVFKRSLSRNWLIVMYCFLMFIPQMAIFLACIGMADILNRGKKTTPNGTQ